MITKVSIDKDRCKGCQYCEIYCPHACIEMSKELNRHGVRYAEFVKRQACTQCGICQNVCPDNCIVVYKGIGDQVAKTAGNMWSGFFDGQKQKEEDL